MRNFNAFRKIKLIVLLSVCALLNIGKLQSQNCHLLEEGGSDDRLYSSTLECAREQIFNSSLQWEGFENYLPNPNDEVKTVRLRIHVIQKPPTEPNGYENFDENNPDHMIWLENLDDQMNHVFSNLQPEVCNLEPVTGNVTDSKFRFKTISIDFIQDLQGWHNYNESPYFSTTLFSLYSNHDAKALDFFIVGVPFNFQTAESYNQTAGVGQAYSGSQSCYLTCFGLYHNYVSHPAWNSETPWERGEPWIYYPLIAHELAHCLGLHHPHQGPPGLNICPNYQHNWCEPGQDNPCTNNMVSSATKRESFTPKQLGTLHRMFSGGWRASLLEECNRVEEPIVIMGNEIWQYARVVNKDILIEAGASLTIHCKLNMPINGKILVKHGAKLIVDGGLITNSCGDLWEGITVLGHTNGSQMNAGMGIVELKNNAIIENARVGITVGQRIYYDQDAWFWGNTGGVVYASESSFLNNEQDVVFHPYQNFNPQTQALMRNKSYFKKCLFEVNREVYGVDQLESRVRLNCIDGVRFIACTFGIENEAMDYYVDAETRGIGLMTVQSSYEVKGSCTNPVQVGSECSPEMVVSSNLNSPDIGIVPSKFNNFQIGIRSSANGPIPSTITTTLFDGNSYGAYLINMQNAKIERNQFDINTTSDRIQYGLHLEGCSGYKVERNSFVGNEDNYEEALYVGVYITNSGPANNETYLNDFENLFAGTVSQGQNGDYLFPNNGLEILCGKHDQVKYNIAALNLDGLDAKLAYRQGDNADFSTDYTAPAGNLFDENNASGEEENDFHVDNETVYTFTYEHHNEDSPFPVVPEELNPNEVTNSPNDPFFTDRNQCCPKVRTNEGNPNGHLDLVLVKRLQIKDLEDDLSGLMDGGNSQIITDFVQNPLNSSAQVRMNLLPLAPYLSDQVLIAALKRAPALNPWHLCEILISCSPLSSKTWVEVEDNTTMSEYLYQLLVEYQNGTNGRWTKEMEIKRLAKAKALSERAYTYWALNDSTEEYHMQPYRDMMTGDEINRSIRMRFSLLLKEKKYAQALVLLEDYESSDDDRWVEVAELICALDSGKHSNVDREAKLTQLEGFANRETEAGRTAWVYLELFDRGALDQKLMLPTLGTRSKKLRSDKRALLSDVYPNPGNDYIYVTFVLPEEREQALVNVYDMGGKKVQTMDITKVHGILEVNASSLNTGPYLYEIILDGKSVSNGKFIIQH